MELEELKASWNAFDKRLAESDIINLRMVKEMIAQKTRRVFDRIYGLNVYYFAMSLFILGVVFPYVYMNTPISTTSFVIVETILVIGLYPHIKKLNLLSKFNLEGKSCHELSSLVLQYKKVCHNETYWTIAIVSIAMVAFYITELGFNQQASYVLGTRVLLVMGLTLLTFALAYVIAQWQRRRHATQMQEIEQGLEELREFER